MIKYVSFGGLSRFLRKEILRATNIPVAIALVVIIVAGGFAEYQRREMHRQDLQAEVLYKVGLVRARLEGAINANLQLARGLVAAIASEPDMPPARFTNLVEHLLDHGPQIINIAAAPDLVVTMLYPLEGNEQALGLDYTQVEGQREAALRARDSRQLVLAGPVNLVQGGQGFIGRFPVFVPEGDGERFWGIVSVVIDVEGLYREAGLLDPDLGIDMAISGRDALGASGAHFFGEASILANNPVRANIMLPSGSWTIAAVPAGGWESRPPDLLRLRLWILLAAALILVPTVITGRLMDERQRNVAQALRRERELETLSRRLKLALETSKVGVWEQDFGQDEEHWDARFNAIFGYPEDGGKRFYRHWSDRLHPDDLDKAMEDYDRAVSKRGTYESQYRIVLPDGEVRHVRAYGVIYSDTGASDRVVGVIFDVTEDVRMTEELRQANAMMEARNAELETARRRIEYNALHDSLTGLPNRRYLDQALAEHAARFEAGKEWAALLHVDLDRFKQINDTMGHAAGDAVLAHAAAVLSSVVAEGDFVARVGGDEFVILCRRPEPGGDLADDRLALLAEDLIKRMREPILFEGHECRCGISIGIAADSDVVADPRRLLINADIALYRAKRQGRNRFQFFNDALQREIVRTKRVADDILVGIEAGQFVPWFQPQVDARTLEIVGVEALARWNHPRDGVLPPAAFMKIAEELNVVGRIDRTIMEQTLKHMAEWDAAGLRVPKASVNVSARRLNDEALIEGLSQARFEPGRLAFELVESIFLDENDDMIAWNVERIKELGIDIEIDDFGTGYASIVSLLKLKPSRLKIDRQFIMPILRSPAQRQLVGSIVEIGKSLGIEVLAEGVETMDHARILRRLGCQALQGYAFARPMPADAFADFARDKGLKKAS